MSYGESDFAYAILLFRFYPYLRAESSQFGNQFVTLCRSAVARPVYHALSSLFRLSGSLYGDDQTLS